MRRALRGLAFVLAASLLVTAAGGFSFLEVLGWAIFFTALYWGSAMDPRRGRCRL